MLLWIETIIFLFGLGIGSFLNVCIIRGYFGEDLGGRSHCRSCQKKLNFKELIPLLSYGLQRGRCRSCGAAFSIQYPLVELATALSFTLLFHFFILPEILVASLPEIVILSLGLFGGISSVLVIFVTDLNYQTIPNGPTLLLAVLGILNSLHRSFLAGTPVFLYDLGGALIIGVFLAILWAVSSGRWMGLGDAKLIFSTSLLLGYPNSLSAFLFAFWLGGITGVVLLLVGKKNLQSRISFGPFILIGSLLAYFFGQKLFIIGSL